MYITEFRISKVTVREVGLNINVEDNEAEVGLIVKMIEGLLHDRWVFPCL